MVDINISTTFLARKDTPENWTSVNPILRDQEIAFESGALTRFKIGDGVRPWSQLAYADGEDGESAYDLAVTSGFVGTVEEWLSSLQGAQGDTGPQGAQGDTGPQGAQGDTGPQGEPGVGGIGGGGGNLQQITRASRWYSYDDGRWISSGTALYGIGNFNKTENCGTGEDPNVEWENMGEYVRAGTIVKGLDLMGRINDSTNSGEWELIIAYTHPDPVSRFMTGMDSDSEITKTDLYRDFWHTPVAIGSAQVPFPNHVNDLLKRSYDLGDFLVPHDGWLLIFMRPIRPEGSTGTDYFYTTYSWLIEHPA